MNIFKFYNQNKKVFWLVVLAIVFLILIIQVLDKLIGVSNENNANVVYVNNKLYENKVDIDEQVTKEQVEKNKDMVIDQFVKYCNAQNIIEAYNLLSTNCKEQIFKTEDIFRDSYYSVIFTEKRLYSKEIYTGNTYKVSFYSNMLSTGKTNEVPYYDYFTIVKENNEEKLNICNYIETCEVNSKFTSQEIQVEIPKKDVYIDYEIYEVKIKNTTQKDMILDTKQKTNAIYLLDKNNVAYYAAGHEILDYNLYIKPQATSIFKIKFIKDINTNKANSLVFSDIIVNYTEGTNKNDYQKAKIEVKI